MMTELDIIKHLARSIDDRKYPYQIPNAFIYSGWECDYWVLSAQGKTKEFEIKTSRSDYLNDCKKDKHKETNGANYFYYVCPEGLISKNEVPDKYGLIYVSIHGSVSIVKKPRLLNDNTFNNWRHLANKMYGRWLVLWKDKFIKKEITRAEWLSGFDLELNNELMTTTIDEQELILKP